MWHCRSLKNNSNNNNIKFLVLDFSSVAPQIKFPTSQNLLKDPLLHRFFA